VQAAADEGTAVGFRLKEMKELTAAGLCGFAGKYRMLLAKAASIGVDERDWLDAGRKFHGCLRFPVPAADAFDAMMRMGADHHLVVKPGDCLAELRQFCRIAGVEALELPARNE
jgi:L-arabinose isomerase